MEEKKKKSIFKRWWFWLIAIIVIVAIGNPSEDDMDSNEASSKQQTSGTKSKEKKTKEYVNTAKEAELFPGEFIVGEDKEVSPGRYDITSLDGSGNFFVYKGDMPRVNEILSLSPDDSMGMSVTKIQVDLEAGEKIGISGINKVKLTPSQIELKTSIPTGSHLVGRDVPAGNYIATSPKGSGNFFVYNKSGMPVVNEILGKDDSGLNLGVEKVKISVKDGQTIVVSGMQLVELN